MRDSGSTTNATGLLVRLAVWGQMVGYLTFGVSLAVEDSPDIFARADAVEFIWPVLLLVAMHLFKLDRLAARYVPRWLLVVLVLTVSVGTLVASIVGATFAFGIPEALETSGWRYMQSTTSITSAIFALSLVVSVILAVRAYQPSPGTSTA